MTGEPTFCGRADLHDYEPFLALNAIDHSSTKTKNPQTNGICERFHKTILDEFYHCLQKEDLPDRKGIAERPGWLAATIRQPTPSSGQKVPRQNSYGDIPGESALAKGKMFEYTR